MEEPFPVYPDGFPPEIIKAFTELAGIAPLGNIAASGTEIIEELGVEHLESGRPIVYTSADSVFQVATHQKIWPVEKLHSICVAMREKLVPPHQVARVIARPFFGEAGQFVRSQERKDFTVVPPKPTLLDWAKEAGYPVVGIGKISDLFAGRGLTVSKPSKGLDICLEDILDTMEQITTGIIVANLGDFDTLWGHRNNPEGFAQGLEEFDRWLPEFEKQLREGNDLAIISADHGCDPTTSSTDHSREFVPLLVWTGVSPGVDLGTRQSFSDVAASMSEFLKLEVDCPGVSFIENLPGVQSNQSMNEADMAPEQPIEGDEEGSEDAPPASENLFFEVIEQESDVEVEDWTEFRKLQQEQVGFSGNLLVAAGKLTHEQLNELVGLALVRWLDRANLLTDEIKKHFKTRKEGVFWGDELVDDELISEEELAGFYVRGCGIPFLQLSGYQVPKEASAALPREAAVATGVLPIDKDGDRITVATARPVDTRVVEEVADWTGCQVRTVLAMRGQLLEALGRVYVTDAADNGKTEPSTNVTADEGEAAGEENAPPKSITEPKMGEEPRGGTEGKAEPEKVELGWLLHTAKAMTRNAYAPHSGLKVGAAVLADDGEVFAGCNVENDSYGLSICAERVAVFKAVSSGKRKIKAVAVFSDRIKGIRPCGACLQVIRQFGPEAHFVFESDGGVVETVSIKELLPQAFSLSESE